MNTTKKIIDAFKKEFKNRTVQQIVDYDSNSYVVCATEMDEDLNNPYFTYNKTSGEIGGFSITANFDKFWDAVDNRTVYENK